MAVIQCNTFVKPVGLKLKLYTLMTPWLFNCNWVGAQRPDYRNFVTVPVADAWGTWPRFNTFQHFSFISSCRLNTHTRMQLFSSILHITTTIIQDPVHSFYAAEGVMSWLCSGVSASSAAAPRTTPRHSPKMYRANSIQFNTTGVMIITGVVSHESACF